MVPAKTKPLAKVTELESDMGIEPMSFWVLSSRYC